MSSLGMILLPQRQSIHLNQCSLNNRVNGKLLTARNIQFHSWAKTTQIVYSVCQARQFHCLELNRHCGKGHESSFCFQQCWGTAPWIINLNNYFALGLVKLGTLYLPSWLGHISSLLLSETKYLHFDISVQSSYKNRD